MSSTGFVAALGKSVSECGPTRPTGDAKFKTHQLPRRNLPDWMVAQLRTSLEEISKKWSLIEFDCY